MRAGPQQQTGTSRIQQVPVQHQQHIRRSWESGQGTPVRKEVAGAILRLFQQKNPNVMQEWRDKLPEFIRRLEEALYRTARSREEYADLHTLERRLQFVAEKLMQRVHRPNGGDYSSQHTVQMFNGLLNGEDAGSAALGGPGGATSFGHGQLGATNLWIGGQQGGPIGSQGGIPGAGNSALGAGGQVALDRAPRPVMGGAGVGFNGEYATAALPAPTLGLSTAVGRGAVNQGSGNVPVMRNGVPIILPRGQRDWGQMEAPALVPTNLVGESVIPNPFLPKAEPPSVLLKQEQQQPQQQQRQHQPQQPQALNVPADLGGMIPVAGQEKPALAGMHVPPPQQTLPWTPNEGTQTGQRLYPMLQEDVVANPMRPVMSTNPLRTFASQQAGSEPLLMQVPTSVTMPPNRAVDTAKQFRANNQVSGGTGLLNLGIPGVDLSGQSPEIVKKKLESHQKWLFFLRHTAKCNLPQTACPYHMNCLRGRELWSHLFQCKNEECDFWKCRHSKSLLRHHCKCTNDRCPLCGPVREKVNKLRELALERGMHKQQNVPLQASQMRPTGASANVQSQMNLMQHMPPGVQGFQPAGGSTSSLQQMAAPILQNSGQKRSFSLAMSPSVSSPMSPPQLSPNALGDLPNGLSLQAHGVPVADMTARSALVNERPAKRPKSLLPVGQPSVPKTLGTSLLETFSVDAIQRHLQVQRASEPPPKKDIALTANSEDCCTVCGQGDLLFEPPCIYCDLCYQRIKRQQVYYTNIQAEDQVKVSFCYQCYVSAAKGDVLTVGQSQFKKSTDLRRMRNDEQVSEPWVQCDQCQIWVHQVCGLFNKGQNDQETHYLCPTCLMDGLKMGTRAVMDPRPKSMYGAQDLPRCKLSQHLEDKLRASLERERTLRARSQGCRALEVPGVEGLTIRVVNNVPKKCEVLPAFYEAFKDKGMPMELPYTQKVIMLFQKLDGVDVCLFCLYVQEYGEDCPPPNKNWVYLSYIDSVRYFRPDIQAGVGNMSLRTFVYHEILIGYMAYIKRLGFKSMFIWACPPCQQGDDYILYCHPPKQKTPNSERLRNWYMEMLKRAKLQGIVKHVSNMFDMYFEGGKDHNSESFSAVAVPYFDGDCWPGEVEKLLKEITESGAQNDKKPKPGMRPSSTKRKPRGRGNSIEEQLMQCIMNGQPSPQWEDFIVVHLREPCSFCRSYITEGHRYVYSPPPGGQRPFQERKFEGIRLDNPSGCRSGPVEHFQLCAPCYDMVEDLVNAGFPSGLPAGLTMYDLRRREVEPVNTVPDPDIQIPCDVLEQRQMFLSLCKGNHYQFDTLRRAKHSSMMVLYHLHNPMAPAFAATCNLCQREMEPGQGLRCTVCPDFDMCQSCKQAGRTHEHPLAQHRQVVPQGGDSSGGRTRTEADLQQRKKAFNRTLKVLLHAFNCNRVHCHAGCETIKRLWKHLSQCPRSVRGGCPDCRRMWSFLNLHARVCNAPDCRVPRCREIRAQMRRQREAHDNMRREQYMMQCKQRRAAEGSGLRPYGS